MARLTVGMLDAMRICLDERLAGSLEIWMDATGETKEAAEKSWDNLERAADWIIQESARRSRATAARELQRRKVQEK